MGQKDSRLEPTLIKRYKVLKMFFITIHYDFGIPNKKYFSTVLLQNLQTFKSISNFISLLSFWYYFKYLKYRTVSLKQYQNGT